MSSITKNFISLCFLGLVLLLTRENLASSWRNIRQEYFACRSPIEYSLGTFDTKFGISQTEFLQTIAQAESIWETALDRDLFAFAPDGHLKVNLRYDNRQDATIRLQQTGAELDSRKEAYEELKAAHAQLKSEYLELKQRFESASHTFSNRQDIYNKTIEKWNNSGGAPSDEYARLNTERLALDQERSTLISLQNKLNAHIDRLNKTSADLNQQVDTVNQQVGLVNKISRENGDEFQEGEYRTDRNGSEINIYQYDSHNQLVRLLVHELGHALGLNHVDDPDAIMYKLNQGESLTLTTADRAELIRICKISKPK